MKAVRPSPTLAELLSDYLSVRRLRASTAACYRRVIRDYLGDWLSKPVAQKDAFMVQSRHTALAKRLAASTANLTMRVLRALLNFAIVNAGAEGASLSNPVSKLSHNRAWYREPRRQGTIPDGKLERWYQAVLSLTEATSRDYLMLLALTGLRKNEGMTLKWADVDLDECTLRIRAENAKNGREHKLPLTRFLLASISTRGNSANTSLGKQVRR